MKYNSKLFQTIKKGTTINIHVICYCHTIHTYINYMYEQKPGYTSIINLNRSNLYVT